MDFSEILPIGTVCKLKGAKKKLMIIGYKKNSKKLIDFNYIGCQFPEGITSKKGQLYFLYDQIDKIYFMGYNEVNYKAKKIKKKKVDNSDIIIFDEDNTDGKNKEEKVSFNPKTQIKKGISKDLLDSIPTQ